MTTPLTHDPHGARAEAFALLGLQAGDGAAEVRAKVRAFCARADARLRAIWQGLSPAQKARVYHADRALYDAAMAAAAASPAPQVPSPAGAAPAAPRKAWGELTPAQKARLYAEDRGAYDALKAAHETHATARGEGADIPAGAAYADLTNRQKHWLATHDRARFDALRAAAERNPR